MDNVQAGIVIVGIVNGFRLLQEKSYWGFIFFAIALFFGVLFGFFHMFGLSIESGVVVALMSSGLYRIGEKIGGQS